MGPTPPLPPAPQPHSFRFQARQTMGCCAGCRSCWPAPGPTAFPRRFWTFGRLGVSTGSVCGCLWVFVIQREGVSFKYLLGTLFKAVAGVPPVNSCNLLVVSIERSAAFVGFKKGKGGFPVFTPRVVPFADRLGCSVRPS